ncbi:MAG: isoprenyl transferase [Alphaproteobacteria bacterium]|nr:isoprenyl transferase [Alphaproteobacteria bacterium]
MKPQISENTTDIPKHVAIIMDGNGRWANKRGLPRTAGHKQGAESVRRIVRAAAELGIEYLTLFGFSSENWKRPDGEVQELMKLLRYYLRAETAELHKSGVCMKVIGDRSAFDADIVQLIENAEELTKDNTQITVLIALNYGGRHDILQAAQNLAAQGDAAELSAEELEQRFCANLMTSAYPDPDVLIRTSGEQRISNFLLWQCAYTELIFTPTLWPDFDKKDLEWALAEYAARDRRFGALKASKR